MASSTSEPNETKGGLWAALFPGGRALLLEGVVIAAVIALAAFLVYHFAVHTIVNRRPLGGANVNIAHATFDQSEASFAVDPSSPQRIVGASNDAGLEVLRVYDSADGGRTWKTSHGPVVAGGSCAHGAPSVAVDARGREYLAFLASPYCGDSLTPYLVVAARPAAGGKWGKLVRVAPSTWKYGFDDAPTLAVDARTGRLYAVWTRSLSKTEATVVISRSDDGGATWSAAAPISTALDHPHRARVAIAANGDVYVAGIDARLGLWIARSHDGGKSFPAPRTAAPLLANPAGGCAQTAGDPLPKELAACEGPDPALDVGAKRIVLVYGDVGANQTPDVRAVTLGLDLKPVGRASVAPPDAKKTLQFFPTSTVDPVTGVFWACWYDSTFDPHAHRAWFTCAASRNGLAWSAPLRASDKPTPTAILYGTLGGSGLYPSVTARGGVAHPVWADGRVIPNSADLFTASIPERRAFAPQD